MTFCINIQNILHKKNPKKIKIKLKLFQNFTNVLFLIKILDEHYILVDLE